MARPAGGGGIRGALAGLTALAVIGAGLWAGALWRGPGPLAGGPRDLPVALTAAAAPLRITVFGTSLSSARYDWPAVLEAQLATCGAQGADFGAEIAVLAQPGADIRWAAGQVDQVLATAPDLVLMEFASNDADLRDGVGRSQARRQTAEVVAALQAAGPDAPAIALVTMGPAAGLRGVLRPRLAGHYAGYRALAEAQSLGLVDLEARWRALGRGERGMDDGLHPDPATARAVIVPALAQWLGC